MWKHHGINTNLLNGETCRTQNMIHLQQNKPHTQESMQPPKTKHKILVIHLIFWSHKTMRMRLQGEQ